MTSMEWQATPQSAPLPPVPPAPATAPTAATATTPGTIVFPGDNGNNISVSVNGQGIHVKQNNTETLIPIHDVVPRGAVVIVESVSAALVLCVVGYPLARAISRWIDRLGHQPHVPVNVMERLTAVESAVDTVAVEVERIGEGQRYAAKLMAARSPERVQGQ